MARDKGKQKASSREPMQLLDNENFLTKLAELFESTKESGTVWLTQKRSTYDVDGDAQMQQDINEDQEYPCLLRATDGKTHISTQIFSKDLLKFHAAYGTLLKSSMSHLRKRDKKREKQKAERIALRKKKLEQDIIIDGPKRGNGRKKRQRKIKAAIKQQEARKAAVKRDEERAKTETIECI
ncbi:hypothetical protein FRC02_011818 [Tulasnella sp. 418]|nr:hypothetical protein FRC02_011818 [Tulasnella sp. 418]